MTYCKTILLLMVCFAKINFSNAQQSNSPVKTTIQTTSSGFTVYRNSQPYFIKGAGGTDYMERLAECGGNSIRTWSTRNATDILNKAATLGLTVTLGLDVARERHGFDYNDTAAVKRQLEKLRGEVRANKNYPALMAWGIGNELNLEYTNIKVWDAVNEIAEMIHQEDPNHLVTTMLAGINKKEITLIKAQCPALNLLSVQVYGGLAKAPEQLIAAGWNGPYMVTEWGPTGHWETMVTPWKAAVEETSSEKARVYKTRYQQSILKDKRCVGSYVFLWGQKQERTPTWYGLFTENGEETEVIDEMQYLWTTKYPANRAPHINLFLLNNKKAIDVVYVSPAKNYPLMVSTSDPNNDPLIFRWELLNESTDLGSGGDREPRPATMPVAVTKTSKNNYRFTSPTKTGAYRIFVYISDGHNKVATGNIPFYVQ